MTEILLTIVFPLILATQLELQTSNYIILPIGILLGIRIFTLYKQKKITVKKDIIDLKQLSKSSIKLILFTTIAVLLLIATKDHYSLPEWLKGGEPQWYILIHVILQELIFRTYLINRLRENINKPWQITIITSVIFSLSHLILPVNLTVLLFTFTGSLLWSHWHQKHPNLPLIILSHTAINVLFTL